MKSEAFEEKTLNRQPLYHGKIIDVVLDEVRLPDGKTATRELVFHPGAVAILAVTNEDKIVMVKQFRKPLEKVILEIPAGKIEQEETTTLGTAKRELEEETSYQAKQWSFVCEFATSPGFANEILFLYEARELCKIENPLPQDEDEWIECVELTVEEAKEAIKTGLIYDAKTILAVQYWLNQS